MGQAVEEVREAADASPTRCTRTGLRRSSAAGSRRLSCSERASNRDAPRLVATDLDGTLLHTDGTVTERTRAVLTALDDLGVPVVFTTGRPIRWMETLWEEVGGHGLAICSNGGIVYDVAQRAVRTARTIPADVLLDVGAAIRSAIPGSTFALEKTTGFAREHDFMPRLRSTRRPTSRPGPSRRSPTTRWSSCWPGTRRSAPEDYWRRVEEVVGERVVPTWSSVGTLVEISAAGVTKATTLATWRPSSGPGPDDVIAFGDMPNDLPLLEWAGTSYAMANAHPSVSSWPTTRPPTTTTTASPTCSIGCSASR